MLAIAAALFATIAPSAQSVVYTGALLGVHASATLYEHHAHIALSGIPMGGKIEGDAVFIDGVGGRVTLEEPLRSALRMRMIEVRSVSQPSDNVIDVVLALPLIGARTVVLVRG